MGQVGLSYDYSPIMAPNYKLYGFVIRQVLSQFFIKPAVFGSGQVNFTIFSKVS